MYQADVLLIDLDGTLVDSSASVTRTWQAWCAEHGIDESRVFAISEGRQACAVIAEVAPHMDAAAEDRRLIEAQLGDADGTVAIPGAADFLRRLPPERWAVVTSCTHELAAARLRAAQLPTPRLLVGAQDVARSKPQPDGFLLAAEKLGLTAERCLAFEDSTAGLESARRAGMTAVAITGVARHPVADGTPAVRDWRSVTVEVGVRLTVRLD